MVELTKVVKEIKSSKDLHESEAGDLLLIKGRRELLIPSDSAYIVRLNYNTNNIYTISVEGEYIVQNHYDIYSKGNNDDLKPFFKNSCLIGSETALVHKLSIIAKQGGLF